MRYSDVAIKETTTEMNQREIVLDERRRTSLAKVGRRSDNRYLVEERPDGTLVLSPATTVTRHELELLRNPEVVKAIEAAEAGDPSTLRRRSHTPRLKG